MKATVIIIILLLMSVSVCTTFGYANEKSSTGNMWSDLFNGKIQVINQAYIENAFLVLENGNVIQGKPGIKTFYGKFRNEYGTISEYTVFADKNVNAAGKVKYEIGGFTSSSGKYFKHLVISEEHDNEQLRLFEMIVESSEAIIDSDILEQRRIDWVNGANSHNVETFTENLYTPNAVYYYQSGNDLRIGRHKVTDAYQYMADPGFNITKLEAIHVEPINSKLVFEIGTWIMPDAKGEYVIVWQLCTDKVWRILFDSNY